MVFHGFWLVSMVFQGGFMVFGWFQWFFKVVKKMSPLLNGLLDYSSIFNQS